MRNPDMQEVATRERKADRLEIIRRFGKSKIVEQNLNPQYDETLAVTVPIELRGVPDEELFAHVLLWDYDRLKSDDLIGQLAVPLADMPRGRSKTAKPYHLSPIPDVDEYNLEPSRLWLSFSRGKPKALAPVIRRPTERKGEDDDWAGDTYVPKVGQTAVDNFQSS